MSDGSIDSLEDYSKTYLTIASFHTAYSDKKIWMNALIKAIENPHVNIIGHLAPEPSFNVDSGEIEFIASKIVQNELPPKNILESWKKQLKLWIKNASTNNFDKTLLLRNFDDLWTEVEDAFARSKTYSDFNAFFQSRVVNGIWGYKTLFVRLSDISPVFDRGFEFLLSGYDKYSNAVEKAKRYFIERNINTGVSSTAYLNAPVWIHCKCKGTQRKPRHNS